MPYTLFFDMAGTIFSSPVDWERENKAGALALANWLVDKELCTKVPASLTATLLNEGRDRRQRAKTEGIEYRLDELIAAVLLQYGVNLSPAQLVDAMEVYLGPELAITKPYPGAVTALQTLHRKGYRLVLLSNTPAPLFVHRSLSSVGLTSLFAEVIISADVGYRKPALGFIEAVRLSVRYEPGRSLLFGDRLYDDVLTAQQLGVSGIILATRDHPDNAKHRSTIKPTAVLAHFDQIPLLVENFVVQQQR
jgi:FMN phosphatase YigB (HAD superfamily)